ncbi:DUF6221 family protein [Streptomyces sp. NPDC015220]|uniref:DUF6221 family protein n=1 Tax=Streptomyces sp. NPDC015220 TaxID=3364947 RepID=UPI0036F5B6FA
MDLHAWITQQVDRVQVAALDATPHSWRDETSPEHGFRVGTTDEAEWVAFTGGPDDDPKQSAADARHIAMNDPATVLRRCHADRRILARHAVDPAAADSRLFATACRGCGTEGDCDDPVTQNINDCPELLDLAHAHGITDDILAGLDRPQAPEVKPRSLADILAPYTPMRDVPAALRGPNWTP